MRAKSGFTLVEILIVVVILGILAAIVIPQFTNASTEAKESALVTDLQTMRSQIELYKIQHNDAIPAPETGGATWPQMTTYTKIDGTANASKTTEFCFGPYLQKLPTNQFNNLSTVDVDGTAGDDSDGWYLNSTSGAFYADDPCHSSL
jgi:general secretion pathway protein G